MKRLFLATVLVVSASQMAVSATVTVTSGEHESFTRIVFDIGDDIDWTQTTTNQGAEIFFDRENLEFVDQNIFARISTNRLESISSSKSTGRTVYSLEFGCDCVVESNSYLERYVVVDIFDAEEPQEIIPLIEALESQIEAPIPPMQRDFLKAFLIPKIGFGEYWEQLWNTVGAMQASVEGGTSLSKPDSTEEFVEIARSRLIEQLTIAAEQGLLEFEGVELQSNIDDETDVVNEDTKSPEIEEPQKPELQWRIETAFDRDSNSIIPPNSEPSHCPEESVVDIGSWALGDDFFTELSAARSLYLGEFDKADPERVSTLIKVYLYYGFGAEASAYLEDYSELVEDHLTLLEISTILDGERSSGPSALANAIDCGGMASLLAMVHAYPELPGPIGTVDSIVEEFSELPVSLRRNFGKRLASSFIDRGNLETGALIANIVERSPGDHGDDQSRLLAKVSLSVGDVESAKMLISEVSEGNSEIAKSALVDLAQLYLDSKDRLSDQQLLDLGAYAEELRGTELGVEVKRLEVMWIANLFGGVAAMEVLALEIERNTENNNVFVEIGSEVFGLISPNSHGFSDYVQTVQRFENLIVGSDAEDETRVKIAENLLDIGIPTMATHVIEGLNQSSELSQVVLAKSMLMSGELKAAIVILNELDANLVGELKVRVFLTEANFKSALGVLQATSNLITVKPSWYPGDWLVASQNDSAAEEILEKHFEHTNSHPTEPLPIDGIEKVIMLSDYRDVLINSSVLEHSISQQIRRP